MSKQSLNLLDNFQSPATAYEIVLKELNKSVNSKDEKIIKVFEVFDALLPNLGVYNQIMKMIRQEFFGSFNIFVFKKKYFYSIFNQTNLQRCGIWKF